MVQGLPAIDWKKAENTVKLFAEVLTLFPGTPDHKKIAVAFGSNVPASAISYRLSVIRKEGAAKGATSGSSSCSPAAKNNGNAAKRALPAVKKNGLKAKGRKRGKKLSDETSDDPDVAMDSDEEESAVETDHETPPTTPMHSAKHDKTTGGRITKRISPRKGKKTNYKTLTDPFFVMDEAKDANGNNIFGEPSATESEDTYATDGSFKEIGTVAAIKTEDAA